MKTIRIVVADDHPMVRDGLVGHLSTEHDFSIVASASDGPEALKAIQSQQADLLLTDIIMPEMTGIELCKAVKKEFPEIKVMAHTVLNDKLYVRQMLQAGADAYMLKDSSADEIKKAIRLVMRNERYLSAGLAQTALDQFIGAEAIEPNQKADIPLTKRELEILKLIIQEHSNQEIAEKLFISARTVDAHKRNLLTKTGAKNIAGLVKYAFQNELFPGF